MSGTFRNSLSFFLTLSACTLALSAAASAHDPVGSLHAFVDYLNRREFRQAYALLSRPLRNEITLGEFQDGADRVKSVRILLVRVLSQNPRMAEARVVVEGLEKYRYNGRKRWRRKKYTGHVVLVPEKGAWHIIQVELNTGPRPRSTRL